MQILTIQAFVIPQMSSGDPKI